MVDHGLSENLAAGTGSGFGIREAIGLWADEVCGCRAILVLDLWTDVTLVFPASYNPNNPQASHFTQVVWKATNELGCASAVCNGIFPASFGVRLTDLYDGALLFTHVPLASQVLRMRVLPARQCRWPIRVRTLTQWL